MKIICLTTDIKRPSTRYRLLQYIPFINSAGIETEVMVLPKGIKRAGILKKCGGYDAVFVQKKLLSVPEQWYIRRITKKIIFDFDDSIMYTRKCFPGSSRRHKRFEHMVNISDLIISGNKYLADSAGSENKEKIKIVPTVTDVSKYPLHLPKNGGFTIGWVGTKSTQDYLNSIMPALKNVAKKYNNVRIKIISDEMPGFCSGRIVWEKWDEDKELMQINGFDIGLMPLPSDPWTNGKCGFKIIQYMSAGIPVVCSPVGANKDIVQDGINGFYADNSSDWEERISRLIDDADLYKMMSLSARDTTEKKYNLSYWGPHLAGLITDVLNGTKPR